MPGATEEAVAGRDDRKGRSDRKEREERIGNPPGEMIEW